MNPLEMSILASLRARSALSAYTLVADTARVNGGLPPRALKEPSSPSFNKAVAIFGM